MVKNPQKPGTDKKGKALLSDTVKDSAQHIWLAGLGAFSKAQEEGGKVFDTLVKEGLSIQRKTQAVAEEKISAATGRMSNMAQNQWDKLENIFEARVAKVLSSLDVPSAHDLQALSARVDALEKTATKRVGTKRVTAKRPLVQRAQDAE
ncbi:poly granule associated family protein [Verminephrobacter aporrectodeae subsp. tuberculatae]|uniref:phasin family protein n=1 Tax=Verminephrobacter aporrectodeae TaxID=1110389 RepID=UPI0022442D9D|nr:phasin family protein [Verminephrobacter aporrectodeae]MCW8200483.1 poly granule associated family protein [Verminephrobacter aporrectodeae subsp. tuberculatae]